MNVADDYLIWSETDTEEIFANEDNDDTLQGFTAKYIAAAAAAAATANTYNLREE